MRYEWGGFNVHYGISLYGGACPVGHSALSHWYFHTLSLVFDSLFDTQKTWER